MDNKILLIVALALSAVAALILLAPAPASEVAQTPEGPAMLLHEEEAALPAAVSQGEPEAAATEVRSAEPQTSSEAAFAAPASRRVVATYFHNTARCVTCRSIEKRSREAIEAAFAVELASGQLTWRALNMEEKENEHYAIDYDLPYASLVLTEVDGEREVRFKALEETWSLVHKKQPLLEDYVEDETRAFLEGR